MKHQKKLIIGNWKMNPLKGAEARSLFKKINQVAITLKNTETVICPPLIYLESLGDLVTKRNCVLGAQDVFWEHDGAYTGQVSPDMLFYTKARYVIIGHSETRSLGETNERIAKKIKSVVQFPLIPILCVGEKVRDDAYEYLQEIRTQLKESLITLNPEELKRVIIAYEPVWAIGKNAQGVCTPDSCKEIVQVMRQIITDLLGDVNQAMQVPILYGGSVNETNAVDFIKEGGVAGLLIGRTSLDPQAFKKLLLDVEKL